jgi:hypothetical protein
MLLMQADRKEMFRMYSEVKGYVCCSVPDMVAPMWTGLTMAGGAFVHALQHLNACNRPQLGLKLKTPSCSRRKFTPAADRSNSSNKHLYSPGWQAGSLPDRVTPAVLFVCMQPITYPAQRVREPSCA